MMTRSKRKCKNGNVILQVSSRDDVEAADQDLLELSEEFLKNEEDQLETRDNKKRKIEDDIDYIYPEMAGFIVPDEYLSSDEEDLDYFPENIGCENEDEDEENEDGDKEDNLIDKLNRSEKDLADALASYINNRMEDIDSSDELEDGDTLEHLGMLDMIDTKSYPKKNKNNQAHVCWKDKEEIFTIYDPKMKKYFVGLEVEEQEKILGLEKEIQNINNETIPIRYQLLESKMDVKIKAIAMKKLNALQNLDSTSSEYYKVKSYLEGLMKIPFGKYCQLPITMENTPSEITNFMIESNRILETAVYGHQQAKSKILQILGKWISNPQSKGSVFSILGPMGNGKTTLVKEGIAKMIQRPFQFISLGGATDSSFLDGHSYTYEGSLPGKIVEILKKTDCMNPVIYFDELDKVSSTPRGEEIINLLIHLTDFSQNDVFMDKYYCDIPLDLSQAVFIFSLNSLEDLNPILRDRMMVIETDKLDESDKVIISEKYMIPKILEEIQLGNEDIIFPEETLRFAIQKYSEEAGVRNLKRCYQTLLEKINIWRLLNFSNQEMENLNFSSDLQSIFKKPLQFPLTVTPDLLEKIVENKKVTHDPPFMMYS